MLLFSSSGQCLALTLSLCDIVNFSFIYTTNDNRTIWFGTPSYGVVTDATA